MEIRVPGPDDWAAVRDLRLAALQDTPLAFGSTYELEAPRTESDWRGWLSRTDGERYVAYDDEGAVGLAAVYLRVEPEGLVPEIVSMWVHPRGRGQGVGRALVDMASRWVAARGYDEVRIMVTYENTAALGFYERLGFTQTGFEQPVPHDDTRMELEMSRPVASTDGRVR
jgi:ribosomal protein S18 acetylase RimI-like enzyme